MTSDREKLVSIIVPAFNVKEYLSDCVRSLQAQTYRAIEILLVDDGSSDGTGELCDAFAENDSRIRVLHRPHAGLAAVRNAGIDASRGKYVTFVDSDDVTDPEYVRALQEAVSSCQAQVGICDYLRFQDGAETPGAEGSGDRTVYASEQAVEAAYLSKRHGINWLVWGKIYDISLFQENGIRYPEGKIHEDTAVTYRLLYLADRVAYVDRVLYFYRIRSASIMTKTFSRDNLCAVEFTREAIDFFLAHEETHLADLATNFHVRICFRQYALAEKFHVFTKEEKREYLTSLRKDIRTYVDLGNLPWWKKAVYHFASVFPYGRLLSAVSAK